MRIGILALQGSVSEHIDSIKRLGAEAIEVKKTSDFSRLNGLIMPGGESTTLRKLLMNSGLWDVINEKDIPIMATCAGTILMGKCKDKTFRKMDFKVNRNHYGRQKDSFQRKIMLESGRSFRGVFIRAPSIDSIGKNITPIAWDEKKIVGCTSAKNMALTFHPELTNNLIFHQMWLDGFK
mgnify:FL=1